MSTKVQKGFGLALLAIVLVGGVWLLPSDEAGALPPYSRLTDYYSDANFTQLVGVCFLNCNGLKECEQGTQQTNHWVWELDYECSGGSDCCTRCIANNSRVPCPQHILNSYPCPECSW